MGSRVNATDMGYLERTATAPQQVPHQAILVQPLSHYRYPGICLDRQHVVLSWLDDSPRCIKTNHCDHRNQCSHQTTTDQRLMPHAMLPHQIVHGFSSFSKLKRVLTWMLRFVRNLRTQKKHSPHSRHKNCRMQSKPYSDGLKFDCLVLKVSSSPRVTL